MESVVRFISVVLWLVIGLAVIDVVDAVAPPSQREYGVGPVTGRVFGGHRIGYRNGMDHKFKFMAAIFWRDRFYCGAMLIEPKLVLTAAHCVFPFRDKLEHLKVWLGGVNLSRPKTYEIHDIYSVREHIKFNPWGPLGPYDIALVYLNQTSSLEPIRLNNETAMEKVGNNLTLLGYGKYEKGGFPLHLRAVKIPLSPKGLCLKIFRPTSVNGKALLCTQAEGRAGCSGDSGGPLIACARRDPVAVGVVTGGGYRCGDTKDPGYYARISFFINWIARYRDDPPDPNSLLPL